MCVKCEHSPHVMTTLVLSGFSKGPQDMTNFAIKTALNSHHRDYEKDLTTCSLYFIFVLDSAWVPYPLSGHHPSKHLPYIHVQMERICIKMGKYNKLR